MLDYKLNIDAVKTVETSVNHIFAVDVSGSMYDALPKMRKHIKNKLALIVKPNDTVSIIYFSSKTQCGVVFEGEKVNTLSDLSALHAAVDRWLQTIGLTGFVEPLQEGMNVAMRLSVNGNVNSFIFMTDGYDNQWSKADIIQKAKKLPEYFDNISFLEYGWYCNRTLIAEMAEVSGGAHIFSEDYQGYEPIMERLFQGKTVKRKPVTIGREFAFYLDNNEVIIVEAKDGVALIPEDIDTVYLMDDGSDYKESIKSMSDEDKYIALYITVHKMKTDMTWELLKSLGDVRLIKLFSNCFSKQEYSTMKEAVKTCIFNESERFKDGVNHSLVPKEDAYTVLAALNDLMSGENFLQTAHEEFSYNRIGASSTQKSLQEDQVKELKEKLQNTTDVEEIKKLGQELADINLWSPKFKETPSDKGEPILNLVLNESRPNISIQITKSGFVEIPDEQVQQLNLPKNVPTHIYRNYTIIKDGILNMKVLPVTLDEKTFAIMKEQNMLEGVYQAEHVYLLDLSKLPLINRKMVKKVSADTFFNQHLKLQQLKAKQKVFKFYIDEVSPKSQVKLAGLYGEEAAKWLESIGIKDYGFSPKVTTEKSGDFYYSKELNIKISGLSSLPSMKAINDKLTKGSKLNLADQVMLEAINEYKEFVDSTMVKNSPVKEQLIKTWLEAETKQVIHQVRQLQYELNKNLYAIIVGQAWFEEFKSLDENELTIHYKDNEVKVQAVIEEKEIAI